MKPKYEVRAYNGYSDTGSLIAVLDSKELALERREKAEAADVEMYERHGAALWPPRAFRVFEVTKIA